MIIATLASGAGAISRSIVQPDEDSRRFRREATASPLGMISPREQPGRWLQRSGPRQRRASPLRAAFCAAIVADHSGHASDFKFTIVSCTIFGATRFQEIRLPRASFRGLADSAVASPGKGRVSDDLSVRDFRVRAILRDADRRAG